MRKILLPVAAVMAASCSTSRVTAVSEELEAAGARHAAMLTADSAVIVRSLDMLSALHIDSPEIVITRRDPPAEIVIRARRVDAGSRVGASAAVTEVATTGAVSSETDSVAVSRSGSSSSERKAPGPGRALRVLAMAAVVILLVRLRRLL